MEEKSYPPVSSFARTPPPPPEGDRPPPPPADRPWEPPPVDRPWEPRPAMGPAKVTLAVLLGLGVVLVGAWAGLVAYAGREYGFAIDDAAAWQQTTQRLVLHLAPGAAAALAGLVLLLVVPGLRRGRRRFPGGLAALLVMAAGAWLVLGRGALAAYLGSSSVAAVPGSPAIAFLLRAGFETGPGIVLLVLGAWSLGLQAVGRGRPRAWVSRPA